MEESTVAPSGVQALRVDPSHCPGWVSGVDRLPSPGERVYTTEGPAVVVRHLGRTGSGGRLLELTLDTDGKTPYFASAANIRVPPAPTDPLRGAGDFLG